MKKSTRKKILFRVGIGVILVSVAGSLLFSFINSNKGAKLVETQQREDAHIENPTPEEFAADIVTVLNRAPEVRDFSVQLTQISDIVAAMDEQFETATGTSIQNYLGKYKVAFNIRLTKTTSLVELDQYILENFPKILSLDPDFVRLEFNIILDTQNLEQFYIVDSQNPALVYDLKYGEDLARGEDPKIVSKLAKLQDQFLLSVISVSGYTTDQYDAATIVINTTQSEDQTVDCVDLIDKAFLTINETSKNPVYLQIFTETDIEGSDPARTMVFSGLIVPDAKTFRDFYTPKTYYQDVSRAEYYLCNGWLYGVALDSISSALSNLA